MPGGDAVKLGVCVEFVLRKSLLRGTRWTDLSGLISRRIGAQAASTTVWMLNVSGAFQPSE